MEDAETEGRRRREQGRGKKKSKGGRKTASMSVTGLSISSPAFFPLVPSVSLLSALSARDDVALVLVLDVCSAIEALCLDIAKASNPSGRFQKRQGESRATILSFFAQWDASCCPSLSLLGVLFSSFLLLSLFCLFFPPFLFLSFFSFSFSPARSACRRTTVSSLL